MQSTAVQRPPRCLSEGGAWGRLESPDTPDSQEAAMTTAATQFPAPRPFTPEECAALTAAGIIAEREQAAVLAGKRCFTVDECLAMLLAGILHEDDRTELIEGVLIYMPPIGDYHVGGTIWLNQLLVQALAGRALVQPQCPIYLNERSAPQPDIAVVRWRPVTESSRSFPIDVYLVIEIADSSLRYDSGPKLAMYAAAGIPEVWIANLRARKVAAHTAPAGSAYTNVRTYRSADIISPGAFPDVSLPVDDFMPPAPGPDVEIA